MIGKRILRKRQVLDSPILRPRLKAQAFIDRCQVEIVDLKGTYVRNAGIKSAAKILDGAELRRVEEFAARQFRRSGFEATFLQYVRPVGICDRHAYDQGRSSELIWIQLPADFGRLDYSRRRAEAITKHLSAIAETRAELLRQFDSWLAPSVGLRQYLWAHRPEAIATARKLLELIPPVALKTVLGYLVTNYWGTTQDGLTCWCVGQITGFWPKLNRGATN
jgi:hypothetical protein